MPVNSFPKQLDEMSREFTSVRSLFEFDRNGDQHFNQLLPTFVLSPWREAALLLLAEIAVSKLPKKIDYSALEHFKAASKMLPSQLSSISQSARNLVTSTFMRHGFLGTATLRLIELAKRSALFEVRPFMGCRDIDPYLWELLSSHGRTNQPESLFGIFTFYIAEIELGEPITSTQGLNEFLQP